MSGQAVSEQKGLEVVKHGALLADYAGVRHYRYQGFEYFVPEVVWRKAESEKPS